MHLRMHNGASVIAATRFSLRTREPLCRVAPIRGNNTIVTRR